MKNFFLKVCSFSLYFQIKFFTVNINAPFWSCDVIKPTFAEPNPHNCRYLGPWVNSVFSLQRMGRVAAVLLVLPLLGQVGGEEVEEKVVKVVKEVGREGENICHTEELESHLVNTTYLESVKVGSTN